MAWIRSVLSHPHASPCGLTAQSRRPCEPRSLKACPRDDCRLQPSASVANFSKSAHCFRNSAAFCLAGRRPRPAWVAAVLRHAMMAPVLAVALPWPPEGRSLEAETTPALGSESAPHLAQSTQPGNASKGTKPSRPAFVPGAEWLAASPLICLITLTVRRGRILGEQGHRFRPFLRTV